MVIFNVGASCIVVRSIDVCEKSKTIMAINLPGQSLGMCANIDRNAIDMCLVS